MTKLHQIFNKMISKYSASVKKLKECNYQDNYYGDQVCMTVSKVNQ